MRRRSAFTLIELLVTMALIIFIMSILSEAFVVGLKTFSNLKAIGDMNDRLRNATSEIRTDLQADHFQGKARLGDPNFWASGLPSQGFLQIYVPTTAPTQWNGTPPRPATFIEGYDGDGIPSAIVTDTALHLSVKQRANRQDKFFSATVPSGSPLLSLQTTIDPNLGWPDARYQDPNGTSYSSPWAEVAYFLVANGETAGSTPLYTLYRAQYVVVPDNSQLNWPSSPPPVPASAFTTPAPGYQEMSCELSPAVMPTQIYFNSPTDLAGNILAQPPPGILPLRAFDPTQPLSVDPNTGLPRAATFVLGDVISFEIQVLLGTPPVAPSQTPTLDPSFTYVSFDTATVPVSATTKYVAAIQVTLRVWDKKTLQARQITIVQDM